MAVLNAAVVPDEPPGRLAHKWKVLISVIFGIFMIILDTTVVNVAFQTLRREYQASLTDAQWIISVYVLALGIATPLSGYLADRFGIKRMYVGGLATFVLGSFLCGLAPSLGTLVAARALQGLGGGVAQPLGAALLFSAFKPHEQGMALGFFGIALVMAPALGPILGGQLVDMELWRWIFFINIPIGILGVTLASRWLRERRPERQPKADPLGLVTAIIGFGSILYAATNVSELGWNSSTVLAWFGVGVVALAIFTVVELFVAKEPLLNLRLFQRPAFLTANFIGYVTVIGLFGAEFLMPVYLQALRGRSALETGFTLLPLAITAGFATPISGRLYDKIGPRPLAVVGFGILMVNTWQLAHIQADTPIQWLLFLLALRGLALGMTVQTTFVTALAAVPPPALARGSSLINGSRFLVQAIGVAILATVLASAQSPAVRAASRAAQESSAAPLQRFGICETPGVPASENYPPGLLDQLRNVPAPAQAQARAAALQGVQQACQENLIGFERAYQVTFYMAVVAVLLAALMPGWPAKWTGRQQAGPGGTGAPPPGH